jgi:hypothetical protein
MPVKSWLDLIPKYNVITLSYCWDITNNRNQTDRAILKMTMTWVSHLQLRASTVLSLLAVNTIIRQYLTLSVKRNTTNYRFQKNRMKNLIGHQAVIQIYFPINQSSTQTFKISHNSVFQLYWVQVLNVSGNYDFDLW